MSRAMEETAAPEVPVTVYQFTDFAAPHEEYNAATQAVTFTTDPEATTVLSYGFNGMSWEPGPGLVSVQLLRSRWCPGERRKQKS